METPIPTVHRANRDILHASATKSERKLCPAKCFVAALAAKRRPRAPGMAIGVATRKPKKDVGKVMQGQYVQFITVLGLDIVLIFFGGCYFPADCLELTPLTQQKNMEVETCGTTIPTFLWAVALDVVGLDYIQ